MTKLPLGTPGGGSCTPISRSLASVLTPRRRMLVVRSVALCCIVGQDLGLRLGCCRHVLIYRDRCMRRRVRVRRIDPH